MPNDDTIKLLKECDAGVKMGITSVKDVIDKTDNIKLHEVLSKYLKDNEKLEHEIHEKLMKFHENDKEPNPIAVAMSWVKTNMNLIKGEHDKVIADLMTDGCHMGTKSLTRYLNQYPAADESTKNLCRDLIKLEDNFSLDLRRFL